MSRLIVLTFGITTYAIFQICFLYQIGFAGNWIVPKAIDDGPVIATLSAVGINLLLLGLFAIQHTIMARITFKRWWTTIVPASTERSIFVLITSLLLLLINWQWRPMPTMVWQVENELGRNLLHALSLTGWGIVLYSTFLINHFDLFGLRQVWLHFKQRPYTQIQFKETSLYRWVRHPLMLGFMIAFWATPDMSQGHMLFAAVISAYALIGIQIEERTLAALHGENYLRYRRRVPMVIPALSKSISIVRPNETKVLDQPSNI